MTSEAVLREFSGIVCERLIKYGHSAISGLGTLKVELIPSTCESMEAEHFVLHPPQKKIILLAPPSVATDLSLISGLASNLGISHEDATEIIKVLINEILSQIPVHISGLGSFSRSSDKLVFNMDPELTTRIAGEYSGLGSVEIHKGNQTSPILRQKKRSKRIPLLLGAGLILIVGYLILDGVWGI